MFETERLSIRPWSLDDASEFFAMYSNEEVVHFLPGMRPDSIDDQIVRMERVIERDRARGDGTGAFTCRLLSNGRLVGSALLKGLPGHDLIEVGWHLDRWAWGQGFASEMGGCMLTHGFETLGLEYIVAVVDPLNERSKRVALRIGMEPRATIRAYDKDLDCFEKFR
ncbi:MAG: GNAT family N-acetyltransferase [Fimbriimonadaceae bacterium]|nr:GNAT family N-acetyltransferase [Fimbriimonadaceae bacterium]